MLLHSRKAVKKGALSYVWISHKGNELSGRSGLFYQDVFPVRSADGDDGASNEVGFGVSGGTFSNTADPGLLYQPQIQKTAAGRLCGSKGTDAGGLSRLHIIQAVVFGHGFISP